MKTMIAKVTRKAKKPKKAAFESINDAIDSPVENGRLFQIDLGKDGQGANRCLYMRAKTPAEAAYVALRTAGGRISCIERQLRVMQPEVVLSALGNLSSAEQARVLRQFIATSTSSDRKSLLESLKTD